MATMDIEVMREFKRIYSIVNNFVADMECKHLFNIDVEPHYIDGELIEVYIAIEEKDNHRILWATNADAFFPRLLTPLIPFLKNYVECLPLMPNGASFGPTPIILMRS